MVLGGMGRSQTTKKFGPIRIAALKHPLGFVFASPLDLLVPTRLSMLGPPPPLLSGPSRRPIPLASTPLSVVEEADEVVFDSVDTVNAGAQAGAGGSNNNSNNNSNNEDDDDGVAATLLVNSTDEPRVDAVTAAWRERERRQRTLRVLMMFLLMLLLMDDNPDRNDGSSSSSAQRGQLRRGRKGSKKTSSTLSTPAPLEPEVYAARLQQDTLLRTLAEQHPRYRALVDRNGATDVERHVREWARQRADEEKDEFATLAAGSGATGTGSGSGGTPGAAAGPSQLLQASAAAASGAGALLDDDPDRQRKVYHYPWNSTGFYRGEWTRQPQQVPPPTTTTAAATTTTTTSHSSRSPDPLHSPQWLQDAVAMESALPRLLERHPDGLGVVVLPPHWRLVTRDDHNLTTLRWERATIDSGGRVQPPLPHTLPSVKESSTTTPATNSTFQVTLSRAGGRVAFQLYSRTVPGLHELSLVDGFVKLYDSASPGYSTRQDVLLRVRGVLIHSIGKLSLVANADVDRMALAINAPGNNGGGVDTAATINREQQHRRLAESLNDLIDRSSTNANVSASSATANLTSLERIRDDALSLYSTDLTNKHPASVIASVSDPRELDAPLHHAVSDFKSSSLPPMAMPRPTSSAAVSRRVAQVVVPPAKVSNTIVVPDSAMRAATAALPPWSHLVIPYPFVRDDADESTRSVRTPVHRSMPPREQLLEANAAGCEFEVDLNVHPVEWTVGAWRNLLTRRFKEQRRLDPSLAVAESNSGSAAPAERPFALRSRRASRARAKALQDQALVMSMVGTIRSPNCGFAADLNATALRTDWETTTGKAVNYSFYMMLVCLAQILVLLRQLLHSQSQSAATRVSLLCIGWQTVLDALLCLAHIYLSLAMQPLFTAFASVAFFKLLIFCVIEMKVGQVLCLFL